MAGDVFSSGPAAAAWRRDPGRPIAADVPHVGMRRVAPRTRVCGCRASGPRGRAVLDRVPRLDDLLELPALHEEAAVVRRQGRAEGRPSATSDFSRSWVPNAIEGETSTAIQVFVLH